MKRTKTKKVDAILTTDWHLRDSVPACRLDDFEEVQWNKVAFISTLQKEYDCPVLHGGDLFEHWKPSPYLLSKTMEHLPDRFYSIYGNHDLPQHSLELQNKCGIYALMKAGKLTVLPGTHWGENPEEKSIEIEGRSICVWHIMTYQGKAPYPGAENPAMSLIRKNNFDLILTGHNHQTFVETYEDRLLVNPGGITRQNSNEAEKEPCVFLWHAASNTVTRVNIDIVKGVVVKPESAERKEIREERINAFISKLEDGSGLDSVNFEINLQKYLEVNNENIQTETKNLILKSIEL